MKLLIVLTLAVCAHGDKLDNTYLPPSFAKTSGGSGSFLQTPLPGPARNGFNGINNGFTRNNDGFAPIGNGFAPTGNGFVPTRNGFAPTGNGFAPSGNLFARFNGLNDVYQPKRPQATFERNAAITRQYNNNNGESYAYGYETENGISAEESGVATNGVEAQGGYSYTGDDGRVYSVRYTADQNGFRPVGDHLPTPPPVPEEIQQALDQNARDEAAGIYDDGSYNDAKYGTADGPNRVYPEVNQIFPANQNINDDDTIVTDSALVLDNDVIRPPGYKNQARNQGQGVQTQGSQAFQPQGFQPQAFQPQGFQPQAFQPRRFQSQSFRPLTGINSANKEYLPPFVQSNFGRRNQNGRRFNRPRPSFDDVNGYRY